MVELFTFDLDSLLAQATAQAANYRHAAPFPHIVLDNFLPPDIAEQILQSFPPPESPVFINRHSENQPGKFGTVDGRQLALAPPFLQHMLLLFNSYTLLYFLEALTGIKALVADPYFSGGGLHQIRNGGSLNVHADFNFLPRIGLYRRINLLFYLNKDWKEEYGGQLELWDGSMQRCVTKIAPVFNRCVIFNTTRHSYHGHPQPLQLPEGRTRKSIAIYYYTRDPAPGEDATHDTIWKKSL